MIVPISVSEPQGRIMLCDKRYRVVNAGRRFGKSYLAGYEMLQMCANKEEAVVWYIAPTLPTARRDMWEGWIKKSDRKTRIPHIPPAYIKKTNEQRMTIEFKNGSMLYLLSASEPDSLRGAGVDLVVFDEAGFMPNDTWEIVAPVLSDKYCEGKALFISTPKGYNWFYDIFMRAKEPEFQSEWESFQFTSIEGGNITEEEIEEKRRSMSAKMFAQEYLASFETLSNRVYYAFDRSLNSIDGEDWFGKSGDVHVGMDFNVNPMTAAIFAEWKQKGELFATEFDEIVEPNSDTQHLCDSLKRKFPNCHIIVYPDPTCRKRQTNGVAGQSDYDILVRNGFEVRVPHAPYASRDKWNCVNMNFCNAAGKRHVFIEKEKCVYSRKAMEGYTYKAGTSEPDKSSGLDHISDAFAYYVNYELPSNDRKIIRPVVMGV